MESNSSTLSQAQKFHLKNSGNAAADANLTSAIKRGNVKSFLKQGVGSIGDGTGIENQQNMALQSHLLQLKNSCCDLSKQIKNKESQTNKFKSQTVFALEKRKQLREERNRLEDKINQLEKNRDQVAAKRDSAFHCSKTYQHILERMKKDSIHNQLKKNQLSRQLKNLQKNLAMIQAKQYSLTEMEKLSSFGVKDAHEQFGQQKLGRKQKLSCIEEETMKKKQFSQKLRNRQSQTDQIQEMAAGDLQDADLMRLKKFLNVQIFLKQLLKSKISRLKKHFQPYQIAFYQIKSRTHVKDAYSLKNQFFNFQNSYSQKTEWVKVLEQEVADVEKERTQLKQKIKQLSNNQVEILQELESKTQTQELVIDRRQISQKSIQYELSWQRISSWMTSQCKKMGINEQQYQEKPDELLKTICRRLQQRRRPQKEEADDKKQSKNQCEKDLQLVQVGVV